jgi:hypothetical protein
MHAPHSDAPPSFLTRCASCHSMTLLLSGHGQRSGNSLDLTQLPAEARGKPVGMRQDGRCGASLSSVCPLICSALLRRGQLSPAQRTAFHRPADDAPAQQQHRHRAHLPAAQARELGGQRTKEERRGSAEGTWVSPRDCSVFSKKQKRAGRSEPASLSVSRPSQCPLHTHTDDNDKTCVPCSS